MWVEVSLKSVKESRVQTSTNESQLLARIGQGDEVALGDLYDRYSRPVYSMVLRITQSETEAEEIVQDVFLKVWRSAGSFDAERAKVFTWITTVARNKAIDRIRSLRRRLPVSGRPDGSDLVEDVADSTDPLGNAIFADESLRLSHMVNELPVKQCQAIQLAFFEGLTHTEIAGRLGETIGTVKARIRLGMEKLRQKVKGAIDDFGGIK